MMLKQEVLEDIINRIVETVRPEKIILFGSAARGEMGPNSDVDLLIIRKGGHSRKLVGQIYRRFAWCRRSSGRRYGLSRGRGAL